MIRRLFLSLVVLLSCMMLAHASFTVVQTGGSGTGVTPSGNTLTITHGSTPANGNAGIIVASGNSGTASISSITETGGTWTRATQNQNSTRGCFVEIWTLPNYSSASGNITITYSSSGIVRAAAYLEVSGFGGTITLDKSNNNNGTATTLDTGTTATTTHATAFWINAYSDQGGTGSSPNNGYTISKQQSDSQTVITAIAATKGVTTTGTAGGTVADVNTTGWVATAAAFYGTSTIDQSNLPIMGVGL